MCFCWREIWVGGRAHSIDLVVLVWRIQNLYQLLCHIIIVRTIEYLNMSMNCHCLIKCAEIKFLMFVCTYLYIEIVKCIINYTNLD